MNVAARKPSMSLDQFLAWEDRQDGRWEFDGFEPRAMVGASTIHNQIVGALEFALRRRLRTPCRVYRETMRLRLAETARYPDLMVVCAPLVDAVELTNPVVVIEVLSASTSREDRIDKNREYEATPGILRYILLEQDTIAAAVYARDGNRWVRSTVTGDGVLLMPETGIELPLAEAYADVGVGDTPKG